MARLPAFLINRVQDVCRREHFLSTAPRSLRDIEVIEAVDGHAAGFDPAAFGTYFRGTWSGQPGVKPGAFACQMSHLKVWREIVARGIPRALVFEDDAQARSSIAHTVANWPEDAELLFLTHRPDTWTHGMPGGRRSPDLEPLAPSLPHRILRKVFCRTLKLWPEAPEENHAPIDIRDALRHVVARGWEPGREIRHPGSEGYGLTLSGARALIALLDEIGSLFAIDWTLVLSGICRDDLAGLTPESPQRFHVLHRYATERPRLKAVISGQPSVSHASAFVGGSVLDHDVWLRDTTASKR